MSGKTKSGRPKKKTGPKKGQSNKYSAKKVISAIKGSAGVKTQICKKLGCARNTLDTYLRRHPTIKTAYDEEFNQVCDLAISGLYIALQAHEPWAIQYFLNKRHSDYTESSDINLKVEGGVLMVPTPVSEPEWSALVKEQRKQNVNID
ncbi:MAG: hypothetical protein GY757_18930 [bacterium]|nr:hypothetical protein [bacterium]